MTLIARDVAGTTVTWRGTIAFLSLFGLLVFVLIGPDPLGVKVKTIPATGEGDVLRQVSYVGIFLIAFLFSSPHQDLRRALVIPRGITVLLVYCCFSLVWAVEPGVAARRLILTTMIIWVLFNAVSQIGYERTINILRIVCVATIALSYFSIMVSPVAVHQIAEVNDPALVGNWRGILPHKNFAGAVCAVTVLIFVFDARRIPLILRGGVIVIALFFLYKSSSKTSLGILFVGLGTGAAFSVYNPRYRGFVVGMLATIVGLLVLTAQFYWTDIISALTRQDALTGRGEIWLTMFAYISDNWVLGSGYGAFWNVGPLSPIYHYSKSWVAGIANAHSGYIDLLAQLGVPGFLLGVWVLVIRPLFKLIVDTSPSRAPLALVTAVLSFCIGHNFTESSLLDRDMIVQVFFVLSLAMVRVLTAKTGPALPREMRLHAPRPTRRRTA